MAVIALVAWRLAAESDGHQEDPARPAGVVQVVLSDRVAAERQVSSFRSRPSREITAWLGEMPAGRKERRGVATVELRTDKVELRHQIKAALARGGGTIELPERAVASTARLPIVKQALHNNCETAALSMLLRAKHIRAAQLELQRQLPRSGPLDPQLDIEGRLVWGDPERGFVGRPEGGGVAGGYGVYQGPIRRLAARRGMQLKDLSGRSARAVYHAVREGRPVMVWIGLSDGPYRTWRSPASREVTGNFGEHTVVLTGIRGDVLKVNDPLVGERTEWTKAEFELMWPRLGRRALTPKHSNLESNSDNP